MEREMQLLFALMCVLLACPASNSTDSDGISSSPSPTMIWSFFVLNYSGTSTLVGSLHSPGWHHFTLAPGGNPFIVLDPQTADVTLTSGYCPPSSPTRELVGAQGRDVAGNVKQGNVSLVIFSSPAYFPLCQSNPVQPPTTPTPSPSQPATSLPDSDAVAGDASFSVNQCHTGSGVPAVVGSFRAKFSPNVDLSKLRMTISNSLFQPALPVVCDPDLLCNITLVSTRPLDTSMQGLYVMTVNYEGGGLSTTSQQLVVSVQCDSLQFSQTLPPPTVASKPTMAVPELPPCSRASVSLGVNEDTPVGTVVTSLPSIPSPGFRFQILDASAAGYFNISHQGSVAVARPLSEPTIGSVYLRVAGLVKNRSVCATDILITIRRVSSRMPEFNQVSYSFAADCNNPSIPIGTVTALDSDRGATANRRFFLNPEDTATSIAIVDPVSGTLWLRSILHQSTTLLVFVENPGTNLTSSAFVHISCTDDNSIVRIGGLRGKGASHPTPTTQRPKMPSPKVVPQAQVAVSSIQSASYPLTVAIRQS
ncbi:protocadherin beta-6-like isoform X2 [Paramacrobiotus metropolitanus]|uniref:protocadherin beta-6-like isoform X2 n=1 Tax=Paramacrobiotus metropolitanus TaxID=2943436 RepID=UPI002445EDED|nr:protocadherin beta-6-like isoform X2 [Paramacrobiotus metropolitanus]